tara:strand:- start:1762 stop:1944 length:183 start_codon:yes stop_codon:yes gene_type:complete
LPKPNSNEGIGTLSKFIHPQQQLTLMHRDLRQAIKSKDKPAPTIPVMVIKNVEVTSNAIN